jgi:hypothetical protein
MALSSKPMICFSDYRASFAVQTMVRAFAINQQAFDSVVLLSGRRLLRANCPTSVRASVRP